jgi:hypothetical protein
MADKIEWFSLTKMAEWFWKTLFIKLNILKLPSIFYNYRQLTSFIRLRQIYIHSKYWIYNHFYSSCTLKVKTVFSTIPLLNSNIYNPRIINKKMNFLQALIISSQTHINKGLMKRNSFVNPLLSHTRWVIQSSSIRTNLQRLP